MKKALLLLLLLAAAAGPAQALQCHVCSSAADCQKPQACSSSSRYCRTRLTVEALTGNLVEKGCVESCTLDAYTPSQVTSGSFTTQCCREDLCNSQRLSGRLPSRAPARALLAGSALPLALALGLLALLWVPGL